MLKMNYRVPQEVSAKTVVPDTKYVSQYKAHPYIRNVFEYTEYKGTKKST
jgi:hypothetical protein